MLTEERWLHIVCRHDELERYRGSVLGAVAMPDERMRGPRDDEEWYYARLPRPSRWIKVVVHYESGKSEIVTAFPRRWFP